MYTSLFQSTAIAALSATAIASSTTATITVTKTVTKAKTVTHISTTTSFVPRCTTYNPEGINIGFGSDPLTITGRGAYIDYSTPVNNSKAVYQGNSFLKGNFAKSSGSNGFDTFQVSYNSVPVLPNTQYEFSIASRQTAPNNVFCQLEIYVNQNYPGQSSQQFNLLGDWESNSVFFDTDANQTVSNFMAYSQCTNANGGGAPVAYSVLFDEVVVAPAS